MVSVLRPGQRILNIPGIGVQTSRRAVGGGNGLLNNLVAYWPLNEAAGANNALDAHTNGLTLTQAASPGSAAGIVYAGARTFNGSTQYFSRASESLLQAGDIDFTFAAWVYPSTTQNRAIVTKDNTTDSREFDVLLETDRTIRFLVFSGASSAGRQDFYSTTKVTVPAWALVTCWHDSVANTLNIQINNDTPESQSRATGVYAGAAAFQIATLNSSGSWVWNGRIGPVAFWKSAAGAGGVLDATKRSLLYNGGAGLPYASFTV